MPSANASGGQRAFGKRQAFAYHWPLTGIVAPRDHRCTSCSFSEEAAMRRLAIYPVLVAALLLTGCTGMKASTEKSVWFVEPRDGSTVGSPFKVVFGVKGMAVEPAGEIKADSGHHHLLIDLGPMNAGEAIPVDATHLHFGKAQTEAEVTLPPGKYKLTMQFANGAHVSYGPAMAATIEVTVK
jgi:hypothetical protein